MHDRPSDAERVPLDGNLFDERDAGWCLLDERSLARDEFPDLPLGNLELGDHVALVSAHLDPRQTAASQLDSAK